MSPEPRTDGRDDASLLARIREGDRVAFEALVLRKRDRAFRLARRVVGQDEDARDVVQLAFLRVWRKARGFRPGSDFDPWFHRIVMNLAIDLVRREKTRRQTQADWAAEVGGAVSGAASGALTGGRAAGTAPEAGSRRAQSHRLDVEEVSRILDVLPACLPPWQRAVFALREIEGMCNDDVARLLGIRSSTVRNHLLQASSVQAGVQAFLAQPQSQGRGRQHLVHQRVVLEAVIGDVDFRAP